MLTGQDRADSRAAAALVVERGFHRERDLVALLDTYLA